MKGPQTTPLGETQTLAPWTADTAPVEMWSDLAPARPVQPGAVEREEGSWTAEDGQVLAWRAWRDASAAARGAVALMHGYGEHSGRYDHVAAALARAGYPVLAIDARGHGRSAGRRGHVDRFDSYVDDLDVLAGRARERWPELPLFVLGHSNGGLIALRYALRKPAGVAGFVVTSPLCKLALDVPVAKELLGRAASRFWPTLAVPSGLDAKLVSQLDEVVEAYRGDPLVFGNTTARWFTEAQHAMADLEGRAHMLDQPFLFLVAGADRIVDPRASQRIFTSLASADRELEVYEDLYHEVLNERRWRDIVCRALLWMERRRG